MKATPVKILDICRHHTEAEFKLFSAVNNKPGKNVGTAAVCTRSASEAVNVDNGSMFIVKVFLMFCIVKKSL